MNDEERNGLMKQRRLAREKYNQLQSNWNSLREYIEENMYQDNWGDSVILAKYLLDKMNELEKSDIIER